MKGSCSPLVLAAALVLATVACGDATSPQRAPLESRRTGGAESEGYRPPADGVLVAGQVETFLKIREATARSLSQPGATAPLEGEEGISGAIEARAAEIRAARSLSVPVEEYLWVRERILEAEAAALTAKLNADVLALLDRALSSLRDRRPSAPDDASRQILDEQIAAFEAEAARVRREAAEKEPPSVRANLGVVAPFRQRLSAVADELAQLRADAAAQGPPAVAPGSPAPGR